MGNRRASSVNRDRSNRTTTTGDVDPAVLGHGAASGDIDGAVAAIVADLHIGTTSDEMRIHPGDVDRAGAAVPANFAPSIQLQRAFVDVDRAHGSRLVAEVNLICGHNIDTGHDIATGRIVDIDHASRSGIRGRLKVLDATDAAAGEIDGANAVCARPHVLPRSVRKAWRINTGIKLGGAAGHVPSTYDTSVATDVEI